MVLKRWWWWLMVGGFFLSQGYPSHKVSILKWSSMTWMMWGTTIWGNLHLWILKNIDDLPSKFSEVPDVWQMFLLNGPFTIYLWDVPPSFTDCYRWFTWIYLVKNMLFLSSWCLIKQLCLTTGGYVHCWKMCRRTDLHFIQFWDEWVTTIR